MLIRLVLARPFPQLLCSLSVIHIDSAQESKGVFTLALLTGPRYGSLPWYIRLCNVSARNHAWDWSGIPCLGPLGKDGLVKFASV